MRFSYATATHVGMVRSTNQDSMFPKEPGVSDGDLMVVVADGMGGHVGGDIASRIAIDAVIASSDSSPAARIRLANDAIRREVAQRPELNGMGTTMSLAEIDADGAAHIAHIGDSRVYHFHDGVLTQVTTDHTVVEELVAKGLLDRREAQRHPHRHMITRALGIDATADVDEFVVVLGIGDRLLLCSDGLTNMVPDTALTEMLQEAESAESAAWTLVEAANTAGGADNTTVAVVDVLR